MTHNLKKTFAILSLAIFGSAILYNCEPDPDSLGEQLFNKDAAKGEEISYPIIAYNINNNDTVRSDASKLITGLSGTGVALSAGVLGSFTESQFGMQKASYVTQLRMPTDNFDFNGDNAKIDSVVLVVRPPANTMDDTYYIADSIKAPGAYDKNDFMVGTETVPVSIEKKSYPVRKYGKIGGASKSMTINVHEVTTFLDTNNESFQRSNANISTGELLGSAVFDGNVSTVTVTKKSDNSNLFTGNLGFRIKLSNTDFFKTHIIDKKGKPELQDASNFTRYFKGIKLSVQESDRYLFQFSPDDMELIMYYKYDKTENGVASRPQTTLKFNLGNLNAHIGQYEYDRTTSKVKDVLNAINKTDGDPKLYVQGMGGPSIGLQIPDQTINKLKELFAKDKIGIVGAKIRMYADPLTWKNTHSVDGDRKFTLVPLVLKDGKLDYSNLSFSSDVVAGLNMYIYGKKTDTTPEYYDFVVTKTLKNIVERPATATAAELENRPLLVNLGTFVKNSQGAAAGAKFTTRAIDMNRAIFVGSDASNANKIQLMVTYATKKIN
ncbi:DUF4270 family protein [Chryseobacterium sp.]|uniref:DUF4270 family protein n=1 Tax=Chryseobacterium sp. TaxID=1871047 RepID=UPI000ECFC3F6|nr:DUF4270 family protein [Chryseobacterium sp.]HCM33902.1 hypothetical protein [Chryseobacterium sp.]